MLCRDCSLHSRARTDSAFLALSVVLCACETDREGERDACDKLDPRFIKCVFIGYSCTQKGYWYYDPLTGHIYVFADVTFHEDNSYYASSLHSHHVPSVISSLVSPLLSRLRLI